MSKNLTDKMNQPNSGGSRGWLLGAAAVLVIAAVAVFWVNRGAGPDGDQNPDTGSVAEQNTGNANDVTADTRSPRKRISQAPTPVDLDEEFDPKLYKPVTLSSPKPSTDDGSLAYVSIPSTSLRKALVTNRYGEYPPLPAALNETVSVRLELPNLDPDTPVSITILDGGVFPEAEGASQLLTTEQWGGIAFRYTTSGNNGHHRIRIQPHGQRVKVLDFYADKDPRNIKL